MKLSRTVTYAVRATLQLAQSGSTAPVPCSRLAADGNMPERFLLQILRTLVTSGILRSTRGVDGGYTLHKSADQVSLLDLIEAIEGPMRAPEPVAEGLTEDAHRRLLAALDKVAKSSRDQLGAIKLSQLVRPPGE